MKKFAAESRTVKLALVALAVFGVACSEPRTDINGKTKGKFLPPSSPAAESPAPEAQKPAVPANPDAPTDESKKEEENKNAAKLPEEFIGRYRLTQAMCVKQVNGANDHVHLDTGSIMSQRTGVIELDLRESDFTLSAKHESAEGDCQLSIVRKLDQVEKRESVTFFQYSIDAEKTVIKKNGSPAQLSECAKFEPILKQEKVEYVVDYSLRDRQTNLPTAEAKLVLVSPSAFCKESEPTAFSDEFLFEKLSIASEAGEERESSDASGSGQGVTSAPASIR